MAPYDVFIVAATLGGLIGLLVSAFYFLSGWRQLRKTYGSDEIRPDDTLVFQSAKIVAPWSLAAYLGVFGIFRNCLVFGHTARGVYLAAMFPLAVINRPVLIPWEDTVLTRIDGYCLSGLKAPEILIEIPQAVFYELQGTGRVIHGDGLSELIA